MAIKDPEESLPGDSLDIGLVHMGVLHRKKNWCLEWVSTVLQKGDSILSSLGARRKNGGERQGGVGLNLHGLAELRVGFAADSIFVEDLGHCLLCRFCWFRPEERESEREEV